MNPRSIANSSGFPLQIRIGHVANSSANWRIHLEEHPWQSIDNSTEGFIDLVLIEVHGVQTMVVECKRVRDSLWVFMIPRVDCRERTHVRLWESSQSNDGWNEFGWKDWQGVASHEAKYCAIPGQEGGRKNLIERTASDLIEATEAFAWQEKVLADKLPSTMRIFGKIYAPVIVTTAELRVACFDPSTISLKEGEIPDNVEFKTVPYIKFRKSLTSRMLTESKADKIKDLHAESERSIFVVNAESFENFIEAWDINHPRW